MAVDMVIEELNKKKNDYLDFIKKLENIIQHKNEEIYHLDKTIKIFEAEKENSLEDELEKQDNPSVINHDFKKTSTKEERQKSREARRASNSTEKDILKQYKELMGG